MSQEYSANGRDEQIGSALRKLKLAKFSELKRETRMSDGKLSRGLRSMVLTEAVLHEGSYYALPEYKGELMTRAAQHLKLDLTALREVRKAVKEAEASKVYGPGSPYQLTKEKVASMTGIVAHIVERPFVFVMHERGWEMLGNGGYFKPVPGWPPAPSKSQ